MWQLLTTALLVAVLESMPHIVALESTFLRKAVTSNSSRFIFIAGLEGSGHHYWSAALNRLTQVLPEVQGFTWHGSATRLKLWEICALDPNYSRTLASYPKTCLNLAPVKDSRSTQKSDYYRDGLTRSYRKSISSLSFNDKNDQFKGDESQLHSTYRSLMSVGREQIGKAKQKFQRLERSKESKAKSLRGRLRTHGFFSNLSTTARNHKYISRQTDKLNATMFMSIVGTETQSYPYGVQVNSMHFIPYIDIDAWSAEAANVDYRILLLQRDPVQLVTSDVCHSHYHRNKFIKSNSMKKNFPGLGWWGGDDPDAVDYYMDILKFSHDALMSQIGQLDSDFFMASLSLRNFRSLYPQCVTNRILLMMRAIACQIADYADINSHNLSFNQMLIAFLFPGAEKNSHFVAKVDSILRDEAHGGNQSFNDSKWQAQLRAFARPGSILVEDAEPMDCEKHVLSRIKVVEFISYMERNSYSV